MLPLQNSKTNENTDQNWSTYSFTITYMLSRCIRTIVFYEIKFNVSALFSVVTPFHICCAPCKSSTKGTENDVVALLKLLLVVPQG